MKQNNLHRRPGPPACGGRYKGRAELTSSVVPRGTSSPHEAETVIVSRSRIGLCVHGWQSLLRPAELGAIAPHAVHDHCQAPRQRGNGLLAPSPLGHVHRPGLQPRPFPGDGQQALRGSLIALLIARREAAGLTQTELAAKLGEYQSFVARLESGQRRVDVVEFLQLAGGFDPHEAMDQLSRIQE